MKEHVKVFIFSFFLVLLAGIGLRLLVDVVILNSELNDISLIGLTLYQISFSIAVSIPIAYAIKKKNEK